MRVELNQKGEYQKLIQRYSSGRYASNQECQFEYQKALFKYSGVSQDPRLEGKSTTFETESPNYEERPNYSQSYQSEPIYSQIPYQYIPQPQTYTQPIIDTSFFKKFGSRDHPLHVQMKEQASIFRTISSVSSFVITAYILYLIYQTMFGEAKQGGGGVRGFVEKSTGLLNDTPLVPTPIGNIRLSDVKGIDDVKFEFEEVIDFLKNPEKYERLGAKLPKGLLLVGEPGTGKTLLGKAIAGEAGVPFYYISASEFEEMFVGVGAKRVRNLFKTARENAPCIVFIDEIDSLAPKRKTIDPSHQRQTPNQLLAEMDGFKSNEGIIIIGATNHVETLDPAVLRPGRFDKHVHVPLPNIKGREEILKLYLDKIKHDEQIDLKRYASLTSGMTGADLANLVNTAAVRAAQKDKKQVDKEDMDFSYDRTVMGIENKSLGKILKEEEKYKTAIHEIGHAIVANYHKSEMHKITIQPRGPSLGATYIIPDENTSQSKKDLLNQISVALGGTIAEEVFFGEDNISVGASNDLQKCTRIANYMVQKFGMSRFGKTVSHDGLSEDSKKEIDMETRRIVQEQYKATLEFMKSKKNEIDRIARFLAKKETISNEEFKQLLEGKTIE